MFAKWATGDKSAIHPDLRSAVFAISIKNGGKKEASHLEIVVNRVVGSSVQTSY